MRRLKIGCCGFPVARKKYFKHFRLVEVQQTFYNPPKIETLQKWREEASPDFEFTVKAWQLITHPPSSPTYRRLGFSISQSKVKRFGSFTPSDDVYGAWHKMEAVAAALRTKVILFQCPPSFKPTSQNKRNMRTFFRNIRRIGYTFIWEPRGQWPPEEVRDLADELRLVHGVDPFKNQPTAGRIRYFRLHGRSGYRYQYTREDLKALRQMTLEDKPCYVLFNNVSMFEDALKFQSLYA